MYIYIHTKEYIRIYIYYMHYIHVVYIYIHLPWFYLPLQTHERTAILGLHRSRLCLEVGNRECMLAASQDSMG